MSNNKFLLYIYLLNIFVIFNTIYYLIDIFNFKINWHDNSNIYKNYKWLVFNYSHEVCVNNVNPLWLVRVIATFVVVWSLNDILIFILLSEKTILEVNFVWQRSIFWTIKYLIDCSYISENLYEIVLLLCVWKM